MKVFLVVALLICTVSSTLAEPTGGVEVYDEIVYVIPDSGAPAIDYDRCFYDPTWPRPPNSEASTIGNSANDPYPASGFPIDEIDLTTDGNRGGRAIGLRICNLPVQQLKKVVVQRQLTKTYGPPDRQGGDFGSPNPKPVYGVPGSPYGPYAPANTIQGGNFGSPNLKPVYGVPGSPYGPHAPASWLHSHGSPIPNKFNQNLVIPPNPSYGTPPVSQNPKPVYGVPGSPYGPNLPTNFYH